MSLELFGDFGMVGGFDTTANPYQNRQTCLNWYPEVTQSKTAKEVVSLLGAPGLIQLTGPTLPPLGSIWPQPSSVTNLPVRALWVLPGNTQALAVIADICYLVTILAPGSSTTPGQLALTKVGTLKTSAGFVCIRDNGIGGSAVIVDGPYGYYYTISSRAFTQITDPGFLGANRVAFIDGWWIFNQPNSAKFYTNALPYSLAFNATLFQFKDSFSDQLMGVFESKEELWLPGEETTEIWYNAGGQYFAFARLAGTMLQIGCKAVGSIARFTTEGQDGLIWFGRSDRGENVVVRVKGFNAEHVSTPAVCDAIAKYTVTSDAIGYTYQEDEHEFYVLTFPTADKTWVFDGSVPLDFAWTERASYDPYAAALHRHRSNCFMNFAGMRIVGDYQNGSLYQMTRAAYTDAGWPLLARRRSPHIWDKDNRERVFMASLQLEFAPGQGTASGMGSDPRETQRHLRDGGTTFGIKIATALGKIGNYLNRAIWRKLGFTRDTVAEIEVIDPVKRDLLGATLKAFGS